MCGVPVISVICRKTAYRIFRRRHPAALNVIDARKALQRKSLSEHRAYETVHSHCKLQEIVNGDRRMLIKGFRRSLSLGICWIDGRNVLIISAFFCIAIGWRNRDHRISAFYFLVSLFMDHICYSIPPM